MNEDTYLIYILEDDPDILELEAYALKSSGYLVQGFACSSLFWEAISTKAPQLILLDIMLPNQDGLSVLSQLKYNNKTAAIPVIMVTAKTSEMDNVNGLDMGADDYISKPFGIMELLSRVRAVLRRCAPAPQKLLIFEEITIDIEKRSVTVNNNPIELAFKEFELFRLLMENPKIVFSRDSLMNQIWGFDYTGETRTVDAHITTLRKKLGYSEKYIKTVRNVGYKLDN